MCLFDVTVAFFFFFASRSILIVLAEFLFFFFSFFSACFIFSLAFFHFLSLSFPFFVFALFRCTSIGWSPSQECCFIPGIGDRCCLLPYLLRRKYGTTRGLLAFVLFSLSCCLASFLPDFASFFWLLFSCFSSSCVFSLVNAQFTMICPMFTTSKLNSLEHYFLHYLDFDVSVSSRLYAKYYFELRTLCEEQTRLFPLQPLTAKQAKTLQVHFLVVFHGVNVCPCCVCCSPLYFFCTILCYCFFPTLLFYLWFVYIRHVLLTWQRPREQSGIVGRLHNEGRARTCICENPSRLSLASCS